MSSTATSQTATPARTRAAGPTGTAPRGVRPPADAGATASRQAAQSADVPPARGGYRVPAEFDVDLRRAVRQAAVMRRGFYLVVLLVALAGQVSGAVQTLRIPLLWAIPAVAALELGGVVVLANADVRRRLGEPATGSRILSALVAAGAVVFNWTAHPRPLLGGFFAGMSALGYLVWLIHAENSRRDRLRAHGALPPTTPAYEPVGHWLAHPWLTRRAKSLAKANPHLGLYESLAAARAEVAAERRNKAITAVLHRKIRNAVDPTVADLAVAVYDLDEIAGRLATRADYDGLTELIATDLTPARLTGPLPQPHGMAKVPALNPVCAAEPIEPACTDVVAREPIAPLGQPPPTKTGHGSAVGDAAIVGPVDVPDTVPGDTAAAVAYWRRREPHLSLADIAARIGRSKRTVYRHWFPTP